MARTKQTSRKTAGGHTIPRSVVYIPKEGEPNETGNVTIVNSSSQSISLALTIQAQTTTVQSANAQWIYLPFGTVVDSEAAAPIKYYSVGRHSVRAGTTATIPLRTDVKAQNVLSWHLTCSTFGVKWRADAFPEHQEHQPGHFKVQLQAHTTYHIVDDEDNPPLTDAQYDLVEATLLKVLQQAAPLKYLWSNIVDQLPPNSEARRTPGQLSLAYEEFPSRFFRLPHWQNRYPTVKKEANANLDWVTQEDLDKNVIPGGRAVVDVYWRALDRQPGGNADTHTVCYTFDCTTLTVSLRTVQNWDGSLSRSESRPSSLSALIQGGFFSHVLTAIRALGPGDSECTVLDLTSRDSEEYDTTWTSHEILVFVPRPWDPSVHQQFSQSFQQTTREFLLVNQRTLHLPTGLFHKILQFASPCDYVPVTRLHQRCVLGPQWYHGGITREPDPEIPPTEIQQAALTTVQGMIGMGRVNTWTDAGDGQSSCRARQEEQTNEVKDDSCTTHFGCSKHPIYFDFQARNVAAANNWKKGGTSDDWD